MTKNKTPPPPLPPRPVVGPKTGSAKARRTAARLAAAQVLYQMQMNKQDAQTVLQEFAAYRIGFEMDGDVLVPADRALLERIVTGVEDRWTDIDAMVSAALSAGGRSKVDVLLDCILRAGVAELLNHADIDTGIIVNDYLTVTRGFYDGEETRLINGILDRIAKQVRS